MNIFIMILSILFMATFFMMDSPSQRVAEQETQYAVEQSDLRAVAQCAVAVHNAQMTNAVFDDICVEQNQITSQYICLNTKFEKTKCDVVRNKKPAFSYIITATGILPDEAFNNMMEILEAEYADAGNFGIFQDGVIVAGGTASKRKVPRGIIEELELTNGQLVYLTQYEIPDNQTEYTVNPVSDVVCPVGTAKIFRFGRWQCTSINTKTTCGGDMIWDSDLMECVADESRKPLCGGNQTAVLVDTVWECISPFPEKNCPDNMVARLNYNTLEWECVEDPKDIQTTNKCDHIRTGTIYGGVGKTLRVVQAKCNDCEKMITDFETCTAVCVPDTSKLTDPRCYPGPADECNGPTRAFYFGFPNAQYATHIQDMNISVPTGDQYSRNRKFNCMDCGEGVIDTEKSQPPYVAICK